MIDELKIVLPNLYFISIIIYYWYDTTPLNPIAITFLLLLLILLFLRKYYLLIWWYISFTLVISYLLFVLITDYYQDQIDKNQFIIHLISINLSLILSILNIFYLKKKIEKQKTKVKIKKTTYE